MFDPSTDFEVKIAHWVETLLKYMLLLHFQELHHIYLSRVKPV